MEIRSIYKTLDKTVLDRRFMTKHLAGSFIIIIPYTEGSLKTTLKDMVGDYRHNSIFDFLTCYYILYSNEFFSCLNFMLVLSIF